ncbi:hypothetical protein ES703_28377 [subsurface metagenome]
MEDMVAKTVDKWLLKEKHDKLVAYCKPTLKSLRYELESFIERIIGRRLFGPHHYKVVR